MIYLTLKILSSYIDLIKARSVDKSVAHKIMIKVLYFRIWTWLSVILVMIRTHNCHWNHWFMDLLTSLVCALHWRQNDHDGVSNHQPHGCLLNRLFRRRSKKTSKLRVTGLCVGNSPGPVNSPHKGPVTRKMFPFDDVIMRGLVALTRYLCYEFCRRFVFFVVEYHISVAFPL